MIRKHRYVLGLSCLLLPAAAFAADASRFPLGKAAPDDVFIFVASRHNPEREFLDRYWARVTDAFWDSGVVEDVWGLVMQAAAKSDDQTEGADEPGADGQPRPQSKEAQIKAVVDRLQAVCRKIEWGQLCANDFLFIGRPGFPSWENVILTRGPKDTVAKNHEGLIALLNEFQAMAGGQLQIEKSEHAGAKLVSLRFGPQVPIGITIALKGDTLALGIGDSLMHDALSLLSGDGKKPRLIESERFKNAFEKLPQAEDSLVFFDVRRMMGGFSQMLKMFGQMEQGERKSPKASVEKTSLRVDDEDEQAAEGDEPAAEDDEVEVNVGPAQIISIVERILHDTSIIDYVAETEWTDGYSTHTAHLTRLTADAKTRPGYKVFVPKDPIEKFDRFVPREAVSFSVDAGFDLRALYGWITAFVREEVPEGKSVLREWENVQKQMGFNLERDCLSWFGDSGAEVTLSGGQSVMLIEVTDEKAAAKAISDLLNFINGQLGDQQGLIITESEIAGSKGFKSVTHPMVMMMPTIPFKEVVLGVAEDHLIIGFGSEGVAKCLKTAKGKHPSITANKRFQSEGLEVRGRVVSVSFTDTSKFGEELQAGLAGVTMGMGMASMFAAQDPEAAHVFKIIPAILSKLTPIAGKLNFYQSECSTTTFDGEAWHTRSVVNYKNPKRVAEEEADEDDDAGDDDDDDAADKSDEADESDDDSAADDE